MVARPRQRACAWLHAHSCMMPATVLTQMEPSIPTSSNRTGNVSEKTPRSLSSERLSHCFVGISSAPARVWVETASARAWRGAVSVGRRWAHLLEGEETLFNPEDEDDSGRAARGSAGATPAVSVCIAPMCVRHRRPSGTCSTSSAVHATRMHGTVRLCELETWYWIGCLRENLPV
jgi:hypothetical protein